MLDWTLLIDPDDELSDEELDDVAGGGQPKPGDE
jgi:hypothetical protein